MLILELAFTSSPERLAARPAHRQRLARLQADGHLVAAGPWADDSGAVLIFDVDRPRLDAIMDADPYYGTSGVRVAGVREWTPVIGLDARGHRHR
ncbi:YciI family protein [Streptomyces sporangiiformans]|uniref:YCII-related domain-containing protein n=1 Tax=Streptomyces sporangiiformans TaxID=2315329 RepID=A0A505D4A7_9ACTN|nr:YciI family protein [Streptomyces sporangiiformans]TPQ15628.1 hypothetical protein FGD71_045860 [Streptomyces sporangiiformans]